jgi:drug/metabolite transporter (DMT)-like permease
LSASAPQLDAGAPPRPAFTLNDAAMAFVVLIWGANISVVKLAIASFPAPAFLALRFAIASTLMGAVLLTRGGWPKLPARTWLRLAALGLVGNTLYQVCFIFGITHTTAANCGLLVAATPVMVTLGGARLGYEKLTRQLLGGVTLGFLGMVLVVSASQPVLGASTLAGDALIFCSSVCWTLYTLGIRALRADVTPLQVTALSMLAGTPALLVIGLPAMLVTHWSEVPWGAWAGVGYSSVFGLVIGYVLWASSVRAVGGSRTAIYNCAIPIVATLTSWVVLGERPTPVQLAGAALIIGGVLLTRRK